MINGYNVLCISSASYASMISDSKSSLLWGPSIHLPCSMSCLCINFYLYNLPGSEPPQPLNVRLYFMNENDSLRFISN